MSRPLEKIKAPSNKKERYNLQATKTRSLMGVMTASIGLGSSDTAEIVAMFRKSAEELESMALDMIGAK